MFDNILKLFKKEENSKNLAKERLKLVLIHDKANVSPQFLEMVKGEIIKVIKQYMEIDENSLDIQLTKTKSDAGDRIVPALVANIPILNVKSSDAEKLKMERKEEKVEAEVKKEIKEEVKENVKNTAPESKPKKTTKKAVKK